MLSPPICSGFVDVRSRPRPRQRRHFHRVDVEPEGRAVVRQRDVRPRVQRQGRGPVHLHAGAPKMPPPATTPFGSRSPRESSCRGPCRYVAPGRCSPATGSPTPQRHRRREPKRGCRAPSPSRSAVEQRAVPYLPPVQVAPLMVPVFPFPEASDTPRRALVETVRGDQPRGLRERRGHRTDEYQQEVEESYDDVAWGEKLYSTARASYKGVPYLSWIPDLGRGFPKITPTIRSVHAVVTSFDEIRQRTRANRGTSASLAHSKSAISRR